MAIPKKNQAEEEQSPKSQLSERYPDPAVEVLDPSFAKYRIFNAAVEHVASGMRWSEGPVWFGGGRFLLWSDPPNNRIIIHRAPFTSDRAKCGTPTKVSPRRCGAVRYLLLQACGGGCGLRSACSITGGTANIARCCCGGNGGWHQDCSSSHSCRLRPPISAGTVRSGNGCLGGLAELTAAEAGPKRRVIE